MPLELQASFSGQSQVRPCQRWPIWKPTCCLYRPEAVGSFHCGRSDFFLHQGAARAWSWWIGGRKSSWPKSSHDRCVAWLHLPKFWILPACLGRGSEVNQDRLLIHNLLVTDADDLLKALDGPHLPNYVAQFSTSILQSECYMFKNCPDA